MTTSAAAPIDLDSLIESGMDKLGNRFLVDQNPDRSESPPADWFDQARFDAGRDFFRRHCLSITFGYFCSLYVGFTVRSLADAVTFTGESSTADRSRRRYLRTMGHLYAWHVHDVVNDRASIGYRSIRYVRRWHDKIRRRLAAVAAADDRSMIDDFYIDQYDTATVQVGFVAPLVLYPRQFGIPKSESRLGDYVYFWRVIGYVLGLDDRSNACGIDLSTTRRIAKEVEQRIVVPGLRAPTEQFQRLSESMIDGMKSIFPWLSSGIIRGYVFRMMMITGDDQQQIQQNVISWKEYFILKFIQAHFFLMRWLPSFYGSYWNRKAFTFFNRLIPDIDHNNDQ